MLRVLLVSPPKRNRDLAYYWDWLESLVDHPDFETDVVATESRSRLAWELFRKRNEVYDLIIYPYGFYNRNIEKWRRTLHQFFSSIKGTKIFFIENEYRLISQKLSYALSLGADYITTQLPKDVADGVYSPFFPPERIIPLPHALNPRVVGELAPVNGAHPREIDLDITGDPYPFYLGHQDRQKLAAYFTGIAERYKLTVNVNVGRGTRLDRASWLRHLFGCKGALHHETGSDYLETNDVTRERVNRYQSEHKEATFEEVFGVIFKGYRNPVRGRALSPRHFEAIGTRTCQIMFRGRFNDILNADEHYIAVDRDFRNIDDVMRRFLDEGYRREMVDAAFEFAIDGHTHRHRIDDMLRFIGAS